MWEVTDPFQEYFEAFNLNPLVVDKLSTLDTIVYCLMFISQHGVEIQVLGHLSLSWQLQFIWDVFPTNSSISLFSPPSIFPQSNLDN